MQLSRLEMYGFKSFAEKTDISFAPGITAFVGPNGCGKSNVVDAIRWVLGEQNPRSLRAGKMEDIFFAGSEKTRTKNYAEVGIVLDNQDRRVDLDYSEITVTRRLYRSGESEYFINRVPCRLKDITEMLTASFLGKGTYSIIGQGQVEEIISSRPEDRRLMFEEAAGVSLYKIRKKDALKKLEETRANLNRIGDIINELEGQQDELADGAERARKYSACMEKADRLELAIWANRHRELSRRLEELAGSRGEIQQKLAHIRESRRDLDGETGVTRAALTRLESEEGELTEELSELGAASTSINYEIQLASERRRDLEKLADNYREQLASLTAEQLHFEERVKELREQSALGEDQVRRCREALLRREHLAALAARLGYYPVRAMKEADQMIIDAMVTSTGDANQLDTSRKQKDELLHMLRTVNAEVSEADGRGTLLAERLTQAEILAEQAEALNGQLEEELTKAREELARQDKHRLDKTRQAGDLDNQLRGVRQQLAVYRQMDEENQGYSHGVRRVLKAVAANKLTGIRGTIAQLIKVKDEAHNLAIETALGGAMQYLVCTNESVCQQAIEFLKQEQAGRATFVPLDLSRKDQPGEIPLPKSALGRGIDLISSSPELLPVLKMLLGNVLVAKDLTLARVVAKETSYRYKVVTCEGDTISRGLFTGGSDKGQSSGLLQRRQAMLALQHQVQDLARKAQAASIAVTDVEEAMIELKARIAELEGGLPEAREAMELGRKQLTEARGNMDSHQRGINECRLKEDQFSQKLEEVDAAIIRLEGQVQVGLVRLETCNVLRDKYKQAEAQVRDLSEQLSSRKNALQLTWLSLKSQADNRLRELNQFQQRMEGLTARITETSSQADNCSTQALELAKKITRLQSSLTETDDRQQAGRHRLLMVRNRKSELQQRLEALFGQIQVKDEEVRRLESALHDLELKQARWDTELEAMVGELADRFGIQPEAAHACYEPGISPSDLNGQLKNIRLEVLNLGEVNLAAIGQHQRLLERLEFLSEQLNDLQRAEKDVTRLIGELDTTIKKLFLDTFNQVQEFFGSIFRDLFEGGTAYLSLSNQDDLFETGVEIFAQPPGKRIQSLSLLSGGEKAMTAIALLFALLSVQPAPFCILDEIEAALDDVNILRFARYLKSLAAGMQFLIITHRRETMEYADNLYGVTLDSNSSSKLISVTLNQQAG